MKTPDPTVSRNYQVGNFQQIEVAGPYDVEVRTGANPSGFGAAAREKLLERTVVEVKGDKLVIRPEEHHGLFHFGWGIAARRSFTVTVPQLSGATIAGSGDIQRRPGRRATASKATVAGSGGLNVGSLDVQSLKLAIAGSGGAKAGGGKAQTAEYEIAGSGDIDAGAVADAAAEGLHRRLGRASRRTRPAPPTSASWARATSTSRAAPSAPSARPGSGDVRCS